MEGAGFIGENGGRGEPGKEDDERKEGKLSDERWHKLEKLE